MLRVAMLVSLVATRAAALDSGPYVPAVRVPDGVAILPLPPAPGSPAAQADRAAFIATRRLRGTPRWRIAADDVGNAPLERYACALGMRLSPASAPVLTRLLDRAGTGALVDPVKRQYHTQRPFIGSRAAVCEPMTQHLSENPDFPSGHAANGWLEAQILASLRPERASALLARGRAYGESRVVCGAHSPSAVEAGWMAGAAMFAVLNGEPAFRSDMEAARHELADLEASAARPDPQQCANEASLLAVRPW